MQIYLDGFMVANQGNVFIYTSNWSHESTWGPALKPLTNESVQIPTGMNLLVDINDPPILNLVIVDGGSLIFPCDYDNEATTKTF